MCSESPPTTAVIRALLKHPGESRNTETCPLPAMRPIRHEYPRRVAPGSRPTSLPTIDPSRDRHLHHHKRSQSLLSCHRSVQWVERGDIVSRVRSDRGKEPQLGASGTGVERVFGRLSTIVGYGRYPVTLPCPVLDLHIQNRKLANFVSYRFMI